MVYYFFTLFWEDIPMLQRKLTNNGTPWFTTAYTAAAGPVLSCS